VQGDFETVFEFYYFFGLGGVEAHGI